MTIKSRETRNMNGAKFFLGCLFVLPLMAPSAAQAQFGDLLKGMKGA